MSSQLNTPPGFGVFVGREAELRTLKATFLPAGESRVCAISGMAGVGKSALIRRFLIDTAERCFRVSFELHRQAYDYDQLAKREQWDLLHLESVDNAESAAVAVWLVKKFPMSGHGVRGS